MPRCFSSDRMKANPIQCYVPRAPISQKQLWTSWFEVCLTLFSSSIHMFVSLLGRIMVSACQFRSDNSLALNKAWAKVDTAQAGGKMSIISCVWLVLKQHTQFKCMNAENTWIFVTASRITFSLSFLSTLMRNVRNEKIKLWLPINLSIWQISL